jgi:uncharacterized membrane protein
MNRKIDRLDLLAFGLIGSSAIATAVVYDRLPDPMPTHYDVHGVPNGWMPLPIGAFLLPAVAVGVWALVRFGGRPLPEAWRDRLDASPLSVVGLLVGGLLAALQGVMLSAALSPEPRLGSGLWLMLGAFFALIGLVMPRVRRNPFIGVRTPWTLSSDENWARTHRFAGYTMTAGGLFAIAAALFGSPMLGLAGVLVGSLAPAAYSWMIARRTS